MSYVVLNLPLFFLLMRLTIMNIESSLKRNVLILTSIIYTTSYIINPLIYGLLCAEFRAQFWKKTLSMKISRMKTIKIKIIRIIIYVICVIFIVFILIIIITLIIIIIIIIIQMSLENQSNLVTCKFKILKLKNLKKKFYLSLE
jgi:hypothetical protein